MMCKYESQCSSYHPIECECEPELCYLFEMFKEYDLKVEDLYVRTQNKSK